MGTLVTMLSEERILFFGRLKHMQGRSPVLCPHVIIIWMFHSCTCLLSICTTSICFFQSYQAYSERAHLTQQLQAVQADNAQLQSLVQEKEQRDTALHSEIMALKSKEKELAGKVHDLERQKSAMSAKLLDVSASAEKQGASPQAPVPKPRTNIQSLQVGPLQIQLERLEEEKKGLRHKLEKEESNRKTVQDSYQRQTTDFQHLTSKHNQLQKENASLKERDEQLQSEILKLQQGIGSQVDGELQQLREQLSSLRHSESNMQRDLQQKESLLEIIKQEKSELQSKVASVEKQKQEVAAAQREKLGEITALKRDKIERDQIISTLEEKLKNPQLQAAEMKSQSALGGKQGAGGPKLQIRLNDALGKVKKLEMVRVIVKATISSTAVQYCNTIAVSY